MSKKKYFIKRNYVLTLIHKEGYYNLIEIELARIVGRE